MKTHHPGLRFIGILSAFLFALLSALPLGSITPAAQAAPMSISGTVYQDFNGNGRMDDKTSATFTSGQSGTIYTAAIDTGVGGVTITAYDANGQVVSATTSGSNGTYALAGLDSAVPYRIEFSGFKEKGYESGANGNLTNTSTITSETSIQFATGGATDINFGVNTTADFCQNNPSIVVNCMRPFDQTAGPFVAKPNLFLFPYSSGGTQTTANVTIYDPNTNKFDAPAPSQLVRVQDIGTTLGIAYNPSAKRVYSAAYMKRHAGLGAGADKIANNSDDARTVYIVDPATPNAVAGYAVVPGTGTNPHEIANYFRDGLSAAGVGAVWQSIGKTALGGLAVSGDGTQLFVMNLEDRTLYGFNLDAQGLPSPATPVRWQTVPGVTAIAGSAASAVAPQTGAPAHPCAEADIRPSAVHYERGSLYVGLVCSAQSSQSATDLTAYIYRVDPATLTFNATPVFSFPLNYQRGLANHGGSPGSANWNPWTDVYANVADASGNPDHLFIYAQPMLTDIAFDHENLILGFRDRAGDQSGNVTPANPLTVDDPNPAISHYRAIAAGEVLRACGSIAGGWTLESNGQCDGSGSGAALQTSFGAAGPGGGEFYYRDEYGYDGTYINNQDNVANYNNTTTNHDEVSVGNVVQVPGFPDVVAGVYDPITTRGPSIYNDGGMRWWSNTNGDLNKLYRLYLGAGDINDQQANFGKANGLGGVVVLCDTAPVEIGNLIWFDTNRNGVQDPNEPPIAGVTLNLYRPGATIGVDKPIATATTDANGNYLFSSDIRGYPTTGNDGSVSGGFTQNDQGGSRSTASARYGIAGLTQSTSGFQIQIDTTQPAVSAFTLTTPIADPSANGTSRDSNAVLNGTNAIISFAVGQAGQNNHTLDAGFYVVPTAITMQNLSATRATDGVTVRWTTAQEVNTLGFHMYRSASSRRADAVRLTTDRIAARGNRSSGASYIWTDTSAAPNTTYTYWVEETDLDGTTSFYGPARSIAQLSTRVFLPMTTGP